MEKTKPILTIGIPEASFEIVQRLQKQIKRQMKDYHVLVYASNGDEPKFQVFYEKDFNKVKFNELKEIVKGELIKN